MEYEKFTENKVYNHKNDWGTLVPRINVENVG
jgi:hypothetical protein